MVENWQKIAKANKKKYASFLKKCDQRKTIKLLPDLHEETFAKIDCFIHLVLKSPILSELQSIKV
jgi:hypothetical protein